LYVKRNVFGGEDKNFTFQIDPQMENNFYLSFNVQLAQGRLQIFLNDNPLTDSFIPVGSPQPIKLSKDQLQVVNTLAFKVSSPGGAFWQVNEYQLSDVLITADVLNTDLGASRQRFTINEDELENAKSIKLNYKPKCLPTEVAALVVAVNGERMFTGVADCNVNNMIEISKDILNVGDNSLSFATDLGTYVIDSITLKTQLKNPEPPVYYFTLDPPEYEYVWMGNGKVWLTLIFTDDLYNKRGQVNINGRMKTFDTQEKYFITDISSDLREGTNSVKISPAVSTLDITELKVQLKSD